MVSRWRRAEGASPSAAISSRSLDTEADSSAVRAGASPIQKGMTGGWPRASSTRTRPGSTLRMRHEVLPSWKMSPAMLSIAKSSLTEPTTVPSGSRTTA